MKWFWAITVILGVLFFAGALVVLGLVLGA